MKKVLLVVFIIILILALVAGGGFLYLKNWYESGLKAVNSGKAGKEIEVEIASGTGTATIATTLEKNDVIKDARVFRMYLKLNKINNLQAGKYTFDNGKEGVKEVVKRLSSGDVQDNSIKITFIEGKTFDDFAKVIEEKTNNTYDDVYNLVNDEEYINSLIEKYWFITEDIKNEDIYCSLEGYIKPDTYTFEDENVSVQKIFEVIFDFTEKFFDTKNDDGETIKDLVPLTGMSIHEVLTLASVVEKEASNTEDMPKIAGVFYNRLNSNMPLGSDVTTYYAFHVNMAESDLTKKQINTENPYNTRGPNMEGKLPVGPICSPSEPAIMAVLKPDIEDYYYFVADKNGKTYFTKTNAEHNKKVQELKDSGMWFTYE